MKAYTDIEQSKNLSKILPIESADMCYRIVAYNLNDTHVYQAYCFAKTLESDIPCWSLAALIELTDKCRMKKTLKNLKQHIKKHNLERNVKRSVIVKIS